MSSLIFVGAILLESARHQNYYMSLIDVIKTNVTCYSLFLTSEKLRMQMASNFFMRTKFVQGMSVSKDKYALMIVLVMPTIFNSA